MRRVVSLTLLICSFAFISIGRDSLFIQGLDGLLEEDFKKAQTSFETDVMKSPSFSSFYNLGVASGSLEEWSKAKWAFESSLKYKPLNGDAQYNAEFATHKLSEKQVWTHPYPWIERVVLGFGINTWLVFVIVSSLFLGFIVFNIISKKTLKSTLKKWCLRLVTPAVLLFIVSFYGIYTTNMHFVKDRYAIIKDSNTVFYISPNGVEIQDEVNLGSRLEVLKYFKDSTWVQVRSQEDNLLWIKNEDLYIY
ncbi:MAG TPA: hypothetical protein VKX29_01620 [Brumimicrobium sp.]|nr:hypothetical protein [Brumimicrobium sp.]